MVGRDGNLSGDVTLINLSWSDCQIDARSKKLVGLLSPCSHAGQWEEQDVLEYCRRQRRRHPVCC